MCRFAEISGFAVDLFTAGALFAIHKTEANISMRKGSVTYYG